MDPFIQKYKAKTIDTAEEITGYIVVSRKHLGNGSYDLKERSYLMCVTEISMPGGKYGTWIVDPETIKPCENQLKLF